jgi:hypothetical protein
MCWLYNSCIKKKIYFCRSKVTYYTYLIYEKNQIKKTPFGRYD